MASFAQLNYVHLEVGSRSYFSVLLSDSYQLSHVLHATDRLADLPRDANERLATVRKLPPMLLEVRLVVLLKSFPRFPLLELHQIGHLVQVDLQDGAVEKGLSIRLSGRQKVLCRSQCQIDLDVRAEQV